MSSDLKVFLEKVNAKIRYSCSPFTDSIGLWRNFHKAYSRKVVTLNRAEILINGEIKPWFSYPAIEFLDSLDLSEMHVFEWGCGNSTLYFNQRSMKTFSVDHHSGWASSIQAKVKGKVVVAQDSKNYVDALKNSNRPWDIVLIDGEHRSDCAKAFIEHLSMHDSKMLIFDNANWFPETTSFLCLKTKWLPILISGFAPLVNYPTQTLFLINPRSEFRLLKKKSPLGTSFWRHPEDRQ